MSKLSNFATVRDNGGLVTSGTRTDHLTSSSQITNSSSYRADATPATHPIVLNQINNNNNEKIYVNIQQAEQFRQLNIRGRICK